MSQRLNSWDHCINSKRLALCIHWTFGPNRALGWLLYTHPLEPFALRPPSAYYSYLLIFMNLLSFFFAPPLFTFADLPTFSLCPHSLPPIPTAVQIRLPYTTLFCCLLFLRNHHTCFYTVVNSFLTALPHYFL